MPQFDQFSFYNQVTWSLFFFVSFYFFMTYFFLPKLAFNIKFRKKKIVVNNKRTNQIDFEKKNILFFFNDSYKTFCSNFEIFLFKKTSLYQINQGNKIKEIPFVRTLLKEKINLFLNQKFLFFKKIFINT